MSPAPLGAFGFQITVQTDPRFDTVRVAQPVSPHSAAITPAGFVALLSYLSGTYFADANFAANTTDARLPQLTITTSSVTVNVLSGDGATVQAELASILVEAGNVGNIT